MQGGLQIWDENLKLVFDTNDRLGIFVETITVPATPYAGGWPVRTFDFTVKEKHPKQEFFFVVLGSGDFNTSDPFASVAYTITFSTVNNTTVRVHKLAEGSPAMTVLVGVM
ncbi:hypothetical protein ACLPHM_05815 [Paenalcaligenes sp. Me131]|uniref:hypothetical protein n=1 Tax=Paenalcaligenes sp. Me131 TaxID=3392636 RepID=UPI003D2E3F50